MCLCVELSGSRRKENGKRPGSRGVAEGKLGQKLGNTGKKPKEQQGRFFPMLKEVNLSFINDDF